MDPLSGLLGGQAPGDQEAMLAAAVLAQANNALIHDFKLEPDLARATRYRDGELVIEATHGAVTARLQFEQNKLRELVIARVVKTFPSARLPIARVVIRTA